jgi:DNA-binding protein YbaB
MLSEWEQKISENTARYQKMADQVQQLSITESSKDGAVRLTIGSNGILTNLMIAETATNKSMSELSREIMTCLQRAQSKIPELLQQTMAETIGTQDETANEIFAKAKKAFPEPPPEEKPSAPSSPTQEMRFGPEHDDNAPPPPMPPRSTPRPPQRQRRDEQPDDDWGDRSIYS